MIFPLQVPQRTHASLAMLGDLAELQTFRLILTLGSLSGAARALGLERAVVSKRLASLERRVGQRLIHRTTRRLVPTDEGMALLAHVERALDELAAAESRIRGGLDEPTGLLRISSPVTIGRRYLAPVAAELASTYPRLDIELQMEDWPVDILSRRVDAAIYLGYLPDNGYVARKLADNRRVFVASPSYLDRRGRPASPQDLMMHSVLKWHDGRIPWHAEGPGGERVELDVHANLRSTHGDVVHQWCVDGYGIMFRSYVDVAEDLAHGRLERVLAEWSDDAPVCILLPTRRLMTLRIKVFIEALARRFEHLLPE